MQTSGGVRLICTCARLIGAMVRSGEAENSLHKKWILVDYDGKNDLLIHRFDGSIEKGKHLLRIEVTDDRGNEKVYERVFTR